VLLVVPYYLTRIAGLPPGQGGLLLAAAPFGSMLATAPAGWLLASVPAWRMLQLGIALALLGLALIAGWGAATPVGWLLPGLLLLGIGQGLLQVGYSEIVTTTLPRAERGVAGSLVMMTRTLGVVSAAALLSLWFDRWQGVARAAGATAEAAFLQGFTVSFLLASAVSLVALLLAAPPSRQSRGR
jgi:MFS family permease